MTPQPATAVPISKSEIGKPLPIKDQSRFFLTTQSTGNDDQFSENNAWKKRAVQGLFPFDTFLAEQYATIENETFIHF
jgi:hypothetical protein